MNIEPVKTIVGFIGLGVMGQSMAGHILSAGYKLHVYTRTKEKAKHIISKGAVWEDSVSDLSSKCDVIITIVGFPTDVEEVYLGENGILNHAKKGAVVIDMTTSSPDLAIKIYEEAKLSGVESLDAPVSGGDLGAQNATLSIMVGGDKKIFDNVLPIFEVMGKNIVLQGKPGSGQHTKMANQIAIAAGVVAVCESLAYARKAGLDPETVLKSIGAGAAGSWTLNNLGPRMIAGNFDPGFYIKHFIKDMTIASTSSRRLGLETPGLDLTLSLYKKMVEMGCEDNGTQALFKLFE
ncbi:MAG: NAD(P)-dependent oxidoreductase [Proteobacteria bacterium]|nr:NAD(P)-dependent oxidoreductase [Pseudomonadota bacterium]MBU1583596.1 NAD(P)-dependent oxidoreductase [Pseudomonadota bacterium]MBU2452487.1 NAD(P)-dependent oxidoreductase [Pseudomonadota bacterium]MBU2629900.1 NAD(P)-dependent oxidoreductase [Pseudomonadota bacterium]